MAACNLSCIAEFFQAYNNFYASIIIIRANLQTQPFGSQPYLEWIGCSYHIKPLPNIVLVATHLKTSKHIFSRLLILGGFITVLLEKSILSSLMAETNKQLTNGLVPIKGMPHATMTIAHLNSSGKNDRLASFMIRDCGGCLKGSIGGNFLFTLFCIFSI